MPSTISTAEQANYETFRDCLSDALIQSLRVVDPPKQKRRSRAGRTKPPVKLHGGDNGDTAGQHATEGNDAEELGEFIEYLASEIFASLPEDLRSLSFSTLQNSPSLSKKFSTPLSPSTLEALTSSLPPSALDSLTLYTSSSSAMSFLSSPLAAYITSTSSPPPIWTTTRASACEICERAHVPLTYHHLIPRAVHAKALKRGWAELWELNKVAWLCRACHSFVHRVAGHEELAREYDSVEKLLGRDDVKAFAGWVGGVRWRSR